MDNLETLAKQYFSELNETDLYILGYICHHKNEVKNMSIHDLAKRCNISHASITRFTQKLKFDGFSELKVHLKYELNDRNIFNESILDDYSNEYQNMYTHMKDIDLTPIFETLNHAARCFVYNASEEEFHIALELKRLFLHSQKVLHLVGKKEELNALLYNVKQNDVFFILASKEDIEVMSLVHTLHKNSIQMIAICPEHASAIRSHTNYQILYQSHIHQGTLKNSAMLFILIEILYLKYLLYTQDTIK